MRKIPPIATAFTGREEGCRLRAYQDSGGVLTIAFGHTGGVRVGETCSQEQADEWLNQDLQKASYRLAQCVNPPTLEALDDYKYATLLDFVFNVGAVSTWPIWSAVNAGDHTETLAHLALYVRDAAGDVVKGLVNRRTAERALYLGNDPLCDQYPLAGAAFTVAAASAVASPKAADTPSQPPSQG